ncbi:hypothetical protein DWV68_04570, partial [Roseburia sp. AF12-17LB]
YFQGLKAVFINTFCPITLKIEYLLITYQIFISAFFQMSTCSVHPRGTFLLYRKAISCKAKKRTVATATVPVYPFQYYFILNFTINYKKHALRVSRVIAALAKSACKHAIFLATRVNQIRTS